jgi:hypothetical protein
MSSIKFAGYGLLVSVLSAAAAQNQTRASGGFGCPATITATESAVAPPSWKAEAAGQATHKFLRPSIYNGAAGKQEYELAPDDQQVEGKTVRQVWKLTDYRDQNLFLRCRYEGTGVTLTADIPAAIKTCTFTFRNVGGNQPVASPVFDCR